MTMLQRARGARTLLTRAVVAALALPAWLPGMAYADAVPTPPSVPPEIRVPVGNVPFLLGHATGTQNYTCQVSTTAASGYAWTLVAPSATLFDDKDKAIVTHYGGPTWEARDGSTVVGTRVDGVTVLPSAIPWLLLSAKSTALGSDGGDRLTATTFIQRVATAGGLPPSGVCDATTVGYAESVPYTADYYFYRAGKAD